MSAPYIEIQAVVGEDPAFAYHPKEAVTLRILLPLHVSRLDAPRLLAKALSRLMAEEEEREAQAEEEV